MTPGKINSDRSARLFKAIEAGNLKVNQRNANSVKEAWIESVYWSEQFKMARLNHLPDPDGFLSRPEVFEAWLLKAYRENFKSEDEARAALHSVRDHIIKSVHAEK
jgi:hypothetical protein